MTEARREWVSCTREPGFRRVPLKPGDTQAVSFTLRAADLTFHNQQMKLVAEPGRYQVWIAPDSVRGLEVEFTLR